MAAFVLVEVFLGAVEVLVVVLLEVSVVSVDFEALAAEVSDFGVVGVSELVVAEVSVVVSLLDNLDYVQWVVAWVFVAD